MREYVILGVVLGLAACNSAGKTGQRDSLPRDTTTIRDPQSVTVSPTPRAESIVSRPRSNVSPSDARTSPGTSSTTRRGAVPGPSTAPHSPGTAGIGTNTTGSAAAADTLRGIVSVNGVSRDRHVMLAPASGGRRVELTGQLAVLIGHVAGADVWVSGTPAGSSLEATRFLVRSVDGSAALDGTLKTEGAALYLVTTDGTRTRIATPPPALVGHDGARVWITGDPSRTVASYGFIDAPR